MLGLKIFVEYQKEVKLALKIAKKKKTNLLI